MTPSTAWGLICPIVDAVLYVLYYVTLVYCLRWLIFDDDGQNVRKPINWPMFIITMVIFVLTTATLAFDILLTIALALEFIPPDYDVYLATGLISTPNRLIVDAVLVYRCWITYAKSLRVICIPLVLWFSCLTSSILLVYYRFVDLSLADSQIFRFSIVFYSCNIATNVYATSAIIYRIVRVTSDNNSDKSHFNKICRILAESGALYTLTSVLLLSAIVANVQPAFGPALLAKLSGTVNFSCAGISFNLILIRVGQRRAHPTHTHLGQKMQNKTVVTTLSTLRFDVPPITSGDQSSDLGEETRTETGTDRSMGLHGTSDGTTDLV